MLALLTAAVPDGRLSGMPADVSTGMPGPGMRERPAPVRLAAPSRVVPRTPRRAATRRWLGCGLIAAGLGMFPWLVVLAISLPGSARAAHWAVAWVGLDAMEGVSLLATGWLLTRQDERCSLTAAITATLVLADAWFDVTTAAGPAEITAVLMAVFIEIPVSLVCATVAVRCFPHRSERHHR
jgi:hypothetical protein